MSLHNVTPTTLEHRCSAPGCTATGLSTIRVVETSAGPQIQITCANGDIECLTPGLPAWEETSPTRDEASREQIRNNRLLHRYLGLPVKE